jgi:hypothetical protein
MTLSAHRVLDDGVIRGPGTAGAVAAPEAGGQTPGMPEWARFRAARPVPGFRTELQMETLG